MQLRPFRRDSGPDTDPKVHSRLAAAHFLWQGADLFGIQRLADAHRPCGPVRLAHRHRTCARCR